MLYETAKECLLALAARPNEGFLDVRGRQPVPLQRIFRETCGFSQPRAAGKDTMPGEASATMPGSSKKTSEVSTVETVEAKVPGFSTISETVEPLGPEDRYTEEAERLGVEQYGKALHENIRANRFQCPGPDCGGIRLAFKPRDCFECDGCGEEIPSKEPFWQCPSCERGICPVCTSTSNTDFTVNPQVIEIQSVLGCIGRGELTQAESGLQRLVNSADPDKPKKRSMLKFELGKVKRKMRKLEEAETEFKEARMTIETQRGCEKQAAGILHELAMLKKDQQDLLEAETCLRKSLQMRITANADMHQVVTTMVELGRVLHDKGDGLAAVELAQEVLRCREKVLLDHHGRLQDCLARACHELGKWSAELGNVDIAELHFIESLAMQYSFDYVNDDAFVASTLHELGRIFEVKEKIRAAEMCFTEARQRDAKCDAKDKEPGEQCT